MKISNEMGFLAVILIALLVFMPWMLLGKENTKASFVKVSCILLFIIIIISMMAGFVIIQNLCGIMWLIVLIVAISGRKKSLFFKED